MHVFFALGYSDFRKCNYRKILQICPPPFCMLASGKTGEGGLTHGIVIFLSDDNYRPIIATWMRDLCTFTGSLMDKTGEK